MKIAKTLAYHIMYLTGIIMLKITIPLILNYTYSFIDSSDIFIIMLI